MGIDLKTKARNVINKHCIMSKCIEQIEMMKINITALYSGKDRLQI